MATNSTSNGVVGVELESNGTPVPGSESSATITATSDVATLAAVVLVNASASDAITLNATENNVTLTEAGIVIQKLD